MSTINPSLQIGGVNGWKGKEGAVLGWQQTSGGLFKPAKFDFTRLSGSASYVDENGLIQIEHRPNYPRFTYQDGKQCLMNEEARTNLLTQTEDFSAGWNTTNAALSTDGTQRPTTEGGDAQLLEGQGGDTSIRFRQATGSLSISDHFLTFRVKAGTCSAVAILISGVNDSSATAFFDLSAGTTPTSGAIINPLANGWYECGIGTDVIGPDISGDANIFLCPDTTTTTWSSNAATSGQNVYIYGAQLEEGSYASSYIPTEGSAVTRAAESIEGLNLGNFLGDSQGGLYVDGQVFDVTQTQYISISDTTLSNTYWVGINGPTTNVESNLRVGGVSQFNIRSAVISNNQFFKAFSGYALNDAALYLDGTQSGTDTSVTPPSDGTNTAVKFNRGDATNNPWRGLIHELRVYDQRPANTQMETQTL